MLLTIYGSPAGYNAVRPGREGCVPVLILRREAGRCHVAVKGGGRGQLDQGEVVVYVVVVVVGVDKHPGHGQPLLPAIVDSIVMLAENYL